MAYISVGLACSVGAFFVGKLTSELYESLEAVTPKTPISFLGGLIKVITNSKISGHGLRWLEWYPEDPLLGGKTEVVGCGLLTAGLGIAGLLFLAKGLRVPK